MRWIRPTPSRAQTAELLIKVGMIGPTRFLREALLGKIGQGGPYSVFDLGCYGPDSPSRLGNVLPEVLLIDVPSEIRIATLRSLAKARPQTALIVLGIECDQTEALPLLEAGAKGYIRQDQGLQDMLEIIHRVSAGEFPCSPQVASQLIARLALGLPHHPDRSPLSSREAQIVALIGQGLTNKEIASRLSIGVGTVKTHVHRTLQKLSVNGRHEAVARTGAHRV